MRRAPLAGLLLCFFLSGAAGLIYQVAWGKALGLIFGHTVYAIATVLAVFMAGLALGSAWFGRWSESHLRPVALYGWIELGVTITAAFSLAGLAGVRAIYLAAYHAVAGSGVALLALRFVGAAIVLFLPTFLMGGTLPILVRGLTRSTAELGLRISRLYWVNTAGAVAGTLLAGFVLLPAFGLRLTVGIAAMINLTVGAAALLLSRRIPGVAPVTSTATPAVSEPHVPGNSRPLTSFLLVSFAAVGATAMAYEIGWSRLLATMLGSSTYAFTLMLGTFLAGIVLGSAFFEWWLPRARRVCVSSFAATQTLTALAALGVLVFFQQLPRVVPPVLRATHESFGGLVLAQFVTSALAMLPAAIVFGFNFPLVTFLIAGGDRLRGQAAAVGRAYAANTLGAIAGALLTGFWLLPRLGGFRVVALAAGANLLLALILALRSDLSGARRWLAATPNAVLLAAVVVGAWTNTFYNRTLATFGTVLYWDLYGSRLTVAETAATTDIVFAIDGLNASVAVARAEGYVALRTNGKVDASNHDVTTQLLSGHLGAIFHPAPRRVLVIGFGSGMTVSALARYPEVERIDCVEIEPAVIRAAPYLERLNHGVLRDPRLRVILDDARNFLLTTPAQYDLIVSEPSNPWIAGVATLFTEEYYRAARARLAPGGIFVQWIQAYSLYPEDLRMVLGTFVPQFPQVTLWHGEAPDLLLLARSVPATLDLDRLHRLWIAPQLRSDFETLGMRRPEGLLGFYLLGDSELRQLAAHTQRNTDDSARLEYRAPRALLAHRLEDRNRELILSYQKAPLPRDLPASDRATSLEAAAETMLNLGENDEAQRFLAGLDGAPLTASSELLRGRLALAQFRFPRAKAAFQAALRLAPGSVEAAQGLAETARQQRDEATAELLLRQVLARKPQFVHALESMAKLKADRGDWAEAAAWQAKRLEADPNPPADERCRLGEYLLHAGKAEWAESALLATLEREPYSYCAHHNLAGLYRQRELWPQARAQLEFVVRYFPDAESGTYLDLADTYRALGQHSKARAILRKGLRIFPRQPQLRHAAGLD